MLPDAGVLSRLLDPSCPYNPVTAAAAAAEAVAAEKITPEGRCGDATRVSKSYGASFLGPHYIKRASGNGCMYSVCDGIDFFFASDLATIECQMLPVITSRRKQSRIGRLTLVSIAGSRSGIVEATAHRARTHLWGEYVESRHAYSGIVYIARFPVHSIAKLQTLLGSSVPPTPSSAGIAAMAAKAAAAARGGLETRGQWKDSLRAINDVILRRHFAHLTR